jgi:hypothetical protein
MRTLLDYYVFGDQINGTTKINENKSNGERPAVTVSGRCRDTETNEPCLLFATAGNVEFPRTVKVWHSSNRLETRNSLSRFSEKAAHWLHFHENKVQSFETTS